MFRKILLILLFVGIANAQLLTQINNQILHLAGNVGVTVTGSGVSTWADQSGNSLDFVQGTDADRPNYVSSTYLDFDISNTEFLGIIDNNLLSFGDASNDEPFSIITYINMDDATKFRIFEKGSGSSTMEYFFTTDATDHLVLICYDANNSNLINRTSTGTLTTSQGSFITVAVTYDGTKSGNGIIFYVNGSVYGSSAGSSGSYTAMENTNAGASIGRSALVGDYSDGKMQDIIITNDVLTPTEITNIGLYFATGDYPPSAPTGFSPADLATNVSIAPTLTWSDGGSGEAAADSYFVKISQNNDLSDSTVYKTITGSKALTGLSNSTMYYWLVGAKNAADTTFSDTLSFTTVSAAMTTKRDFGGYTKFKGFKK